jgi:hypothetical protein
VHEARFGEADGGRRRRPRIAATSNSSVTALLTSPVAAFRCTPQSLRLIVALPAKRARRLPHRSFSAPVSRKSTLTGLVTPRMVRSPVTLKVVSPTCSTPVEVKVMVGWLSMSRNLLRSGASRRGLRGLDALRLDGELGARLRRVVAVQARAALEISNCPCTLVPIVCRATKPIRGWAVSRM